MVKFLDVFRKKEAVQNNIVSITKLNPEASSFPVDGYSRQIYDGSKYPNDFGDTKFFYPDYLTLRARSVQLYKENVYARGLIRRLVTNEINTGLTPEVIPNEGLLGFKDGELDDWSEEVEDRFEIWANSSKLCDTTRQSDFGALQRTVRREAIIVGDVLVVLRLDSRTGLPRLQIISGENVVNPNITSDADSNLSDGFRIEYGVELNQFNQQVAYYVLDKTGAINRIPAFGAQSGRRVAWLVYGTDKRIGAVRGEPILSIVLLSLKEIDRYRDATQRKAALNAILALFIKKTENKIGTKPITGGAVRKASIETITNDEAPRKHEVANLIPGMVIEDLQVGEEPVAFGNQGIDTKFGEFESAMLQAIAWANEIPPEILQQSFSSNYSASQAAINEFKIYLNKFRAEFSATFCRPVYEQWLIGQVLDQRIQARGFLEAWRDPLQYDIYGFWITSDWGGAIKPSTDVRKQAQGYKLMVAEGWITNGRATKELTGTDWGRNMKTIKRENELKEESGLQVEPSSTIAEGDIDNSESPTEED